MLNYKINVKEQDNSNKVFDIKIESKDAFVTWYLLFKKNIDEGKEISYEEIQTEESLTK